MFDFWKAARERWLLFGALVALVLLVIVKVKFAVPEFMKAPDWATWVSFFQSKAFEDIVGDLLTGLIAAYFFYVLIDLVPRTKRERLSRGTLNLLVASIIDSYIKRHWFGHAMAITQVSELILTKDSIDQCLKEVDEKPGLGKLKCALFTAHSRLPDFQKTLTIAAMLGPEETLQWLVITDKVRLLVEEYGNEPESDVYTSTQVFDVNNTPEVDRDDREFIDYASGVHAFRSSLQSCFYEFLEEARRWVAPGDSKIEQPLEEDDVTAPGTASVA